MESSVTTSTSASDRAAAMVLVFAIPAFFVLLLVGWHRIFISTFSEGARLFSWPSAGFIAFGAVALARAAASERVRFKDDSAGSVMDRIWWFYFAVLLFFSALGTLSALIYYGEGSKLMSENVDRARACLTSLETATASLVTTSVYDEVQMRVTRQLDALEREIRNTRNCGDGPEAIKIIQTIQADLPAYRRLSGRNEGCEHNEETIKQYRDQAMAQLPLTDAYRTDRVAEKQALRTELPVILGRNRVAMAMAKDQLGSSGFGIDKARTAVEGAVKDVNEYGEKARALGPLSFELRCDVELDNVRGLGSFFQVIPVILSRLTRPVTYVYLGLAFVIDWVLVMFLARVIMGTRLKNAHSRGADPMSRGGRPKPLWVND